MKRGKDEEKTMGPMFPRLHVNDTEKGGPRAPPRNKMALYEQLSIPSQRFSHSTHPYNPNSSAVNLVPPSSQGSGNDRDTFLYSQVPPAPRHPSEMQYNRYSESTPLAQVEQRKNCDEDECTVPVFVHSLPCNQFDDYNNNMDREKLSPFRPSYFRHPLKSQEAKETGMLGNNMRQEGMKKQTANIDRSRTDDPIRPELYSKSRPSSDSSYTTVLGENMRVVAKGISSDSNEALSSKDQNIVHDLSYDSGSGEDGSCRALQTNLERGDSVSETSVLDAMSGVDITPDDVVGIIGQKHFWKARRAIATQQRAFAVQVFELHRLIKVQRLIAASPHLLTDDSAYFGEPIKALTGKKLPLDYTVKVVPNLYKRKGENPDKPTQKKECSAENTVDKNGTPLSKSSPPHSIASGDHHQNARNPFFNQPPQGGHQWLIPVMSPSEGLVYKPYPGPGFVGQSCGSGSFFNPSSYGGVPIPPPQQYSLPSFPPSAPAHGYFPPYVMPPFMNTSAFSGSSFEQIKPTEFTMPSQKVLESRASEDNIETQGSTASSPNERLPGGRRSSAVARRNMLPLFPTSPPDIIDGSDSSPVLCAPVVRPARVIKVVPRDGLSASESAARIFRSIQEERRQHFSDSV